MLTVTGIKVPYVDRSIFPPNAHCVFKARISTTFASQLIGAISYHGDRHDTMVFISSQYIGMSLCIQSDRYL